MLLMTIRTLRLDVGDLKLSEQLFLDIFQRYTGSQLLNVVTQQLNFGE